MIFIPYTRTAVCAGAMEFSIAACPVALLLHINSAINIFFRMQEMIVEGCCPLAQPNLRSAVIVFHLKIRNRMAKVCASSSMGVAQNINLRKPRSIFISLRSRSISFAVVLSCSLTSVKVSSTCLRA